MKHLGGKWFCMVYVEWFPGGLPMDLHLWMAMQEQRDTTKNLSIVDVIIMSRVFVEDGRKVYIALDVLGFPVMSRLRATFRTFYVVDYHPWPISPA